MPNVSNLVKTIQDIMRKDAGTYGDAQRLEQLGWMFFLKIFDDREKEMELVRDDYRSPLPQHLRWSAWAADDEGITGDALLDFVNNTLLTKLKALTGGGDKIAGLIRMAFEDANNYMKNGTLMRQRVDVIVTNPPFGGMEEDGIESNYPAEFRTRETADLFLVLLMKILKPGGRAGLVLPDGTLFGEGVKTRIKEALLTECNLHTIVRLPNGVFNPCTGIRTNLLFFTKGQPTTHVWYYEHPYPPGAKSYNKGKPIRIEEFEGERAWWGSGKDFFAARVENEQAWRVSLDQIKAGNFNLDLKNPHNPDTGPGDVDHLLPEYERLLAQIAETRAQLKAQLMEALTR